MKAIGYDKREKWALEQLSEYLKRILEEFDAVEQGEIRPKLANYTIGFLGVSMKLGY